MPVSFLNITQRETYGKYTGKLLPKELSEYFHLDVVDLKHISQKRGKHN